MPGVYPIEENMLFELTFKFELFGQAVMNVLHYKVLDVGAGSDVFQEYNSWLTAAGPGGFLDAIMEPLSNEFESSEIVIQCIYPTRYARRSLIPDPIVQGGFVGPALPPGSSLALTKRGDLGTRHGIGAILTGGHATAKQEGGLWDVDYMNAIASSWFFAKDQFLSPDGILYGPVLYDRVAPLFSAAFDNFLPHPEVRTMRRRVVGRGI